MEEQMSQEEITKFLKEIKGGTKFVAEGDAPDVKETLTFDFRISGMGISVMTTDYPRVRVEKGSLKESPWLIATSKTPAPVKIISVKLAP